MLLRFVRELIRWLVEQFDLDVPVEAFLMWSVVNWMR